MEKTNGIEIRERGLRLAVERLEAAEADQDAGLATIATGEALAWLCSIDELRGQQTDDGVVAGLRWMRDRMLHDRHEPIWVDGLNTARWDDGFHWDDGSVWGGGGTFRLDASALDGGDRLSGGEPGTRWLSSEHLPEPNDKRGRNPAKVKLYDDHVAEHLALDTFREAMAVLGIALAE